MTPVAFSGVLVIDKPTGVTSFTVVKKLRAALGARRVGHGGTLDPLATGVLPVCVGEATKLGAFLLDADKEYEVRAVFGVETDTLDADGAPVAHGATAAVTEDAVRGVLPSLTGRLMQLPPVYSALKQDGRRLHAMARAGEVVTPEERPITVHSIDVLGFEALGREGRPAVALRVACSKGTYVRSLVRDLGRALGTFATVAALRRTRSGPFAIADAVGMEDALSRHAARAPLPWIGPADALGHLPRVQVSPAVAGALEEGRLVEARELGVSPPAGLFVILRAAGDLLAVAEMGPGGAVLSRRVFGVGAQRAPRARLEAVEEA